MEAGVETLHMTDVTFLNKVRSNVTGKMTDEWEGRMNEGQRQGKENRLYTKRYRKGAQERIELM